MKSFDDENAHLSYRVVDGALVDTSKWSTPDEGALLNEKKQRYFLRKKAIELYLAGVDKNDIKERTSIGSKQAYRLIKERCLAIHEDGQPYGWRGLVPSIRIKIYTRVKKIKVDQYGSGAAGAMQTLLAAHPDLRADFERRILARPPEKILAESKQSRIGHSTWFLDQLRRLGYEHRGEWPFTTASLGYYSVRRYVDSLLEKNSIALAYSKGGDDFVTKLKTGDGSNRPVHKYMQRVEMDAHKLDGIFCVSLPQPDGSFQEKVVHRLWVVVLIEVTSRAVLGYHFSMRKEVSKDDVLRAIKSALGRWVPREVSFSDMPYRDGAGLPSVLGERFIGLCWDETSVDGALAETCTHVKESLQKVVGSTLLEPRTSFSRQRRKDDRPFIETFFRNLAGKGFQRLSNTTGAKPQDKRGRRPDIVALTSRFQFEYAEELLDVLIANYNATPHKGIGRRSPLDYAKFLNQHSGDKLRRAEPELIESIFSVRMRCIVKGGAAQGRAPYVNAKYGLYTNETLSSRQDLVGTHIWVTFHKETDCRIALASTLEGTRLGVLRVAPPWNLTPHSLAVRIAICQARARGQFDIPSGSDGIRVFMDFVETHKGKKLPVHPAYMEARRILVRQAEQAIGESMLKSAKERISEQDEKNSSTIGQKKNPANANQNINLPPRRMAATEKS